MNPNVIYTIIGWTLTFLTCHSLAYTCNNGWVKKKFGCKITDDDTLVLDFEIESGEIQYQIPHEEYHLEITPDRSFGAEKEGEEEKSVRKCSPVLNVNISRHVVKRIECVAFVYRQQNLYDYQKTYRLQLVKIQNSENPINKASSKNPIDKAINNNNIDKAISSNTIDNTTIINNTQIIFTEHSYKPPWLSHICCQNYYKFVNLNVKSKRYDEIELSWRRRWFLMRHVWIRYWDTYVATDDKGVYNKGPAFTATNVTLEKDVMCALRRECVIKIHNLVACNPYRVCVGVQTVEGLYERCLNAKTRCFQGYQGANKRRKHGMASEESGKQGGVYLTVELISLITIGGLLATACVTVVIVKWCRIEQNDVNEQEPQPFILPRGDPSTYSAELEEEEEEQEEDNTVFYHYPKMPTTSELSQSKDSSGDIAPLCENNNEMIC